ncbi:proteasome regulatory particle base subunit rpn10 [Malassezia cuniculi]|uniref:Proteasome regulatory particle base subunit rpn10 n=1 Tax=Malassezia cuniculi TaxID=948313 RepID=A0AAF0EVW3_9BASI|nr:proteasome regulatory particle base subunit rpn10 [Malassezia cuniculi]
MALETTMIVVDNSEWMRNGDFPPTRWDALIDAVTVVFDAKTGMHPENTVGIMTMAGNSPTVLTTPSQDLGKIISGIHSSKLHGSIDMVAGLNVAQLALKHRMNKNQRQRIIAFVASPVDSSDEELALLARRLRKNNVSVDIISFGEVLTNGDKLQRFIDALDNRGSSHLVNVSNSSLLLSDVIMSSPLVMGEASSSGGAASLNPVDPNEDPELAMALRLSLEEEQARRRAAESNEAGTDVSTAPQVNMAQAATGSLVPTDAPPHTGNGTLETQQRSEQMAEDALMQESVSIADSARAVVAGEDGDEEMTEEEAIARAIEMSLKDSQGGA